LVIVIPPARKDYRENLPDHKILFSRLYSLLEKNNVFIVNYYDDNSFGLEDFGDFDHLNYLGAKKLTEKLNILLHGSD
jgi:hypothetical protein